MIDLYSQILVDRIIDQYCTHFHLIKDFNEYQHFVTRLSLIHPITFPEDLFDRKISELEHLLMIEPEEAFDEMVNSDDNGYLKEIAQVADEDIKNYFYVTRIADDTSIFERNFKHVHRPVSGLIDRAYGVLNDTTINMMCRVSMNPDLRQLEGTVCVNGIGYLMNLRRVSDHKREQLKETFWDLYRYYLDGVSEHGLSDRNLVYGLTHCVINLSNFYTRHLIDAMRDLPVEKFNLVRDTKETISNLLKDRYQHGFKELTSDMLAELLVVYKLIPEHVYGDHEVYRSYDLNNYVINAAYLTLRSRIDPVYGYIRDHKEENLSLDLKRNEHTNILYILFSSRI